MDHKTAIIGAMAAAIIILFALLLSPNLFVAFELTDLVGMPARYEFNADDLSSMTNTQGQEIGNKIMQRMALCKPTQYKINFSEGVYVNIIVKGIEGNNCLLSSRTTLNMFSETPSPENGFDCKIPLEEIQKFGNPTLAISNSDFNNEKYCVETASTR